MPEPNPRITELLYVATAESADELMPLVYDELRSLARARLAREKPGHTLQPTALVHEAFLRVAGAGAGDPQWHGRRHFFAAAAEAMRRILIEQARRRGRLRRGGDAERQELGDPELAIDGPAPDDVLTVHEALASLEAADPRAREIVNLRYFTGRSNRETADALGISLATVEREWRFIRTYLQRAMDRGDGA